MLKTGLLLAASRRPQQGLTQSRRVVLASQRNPSLGHRLRVEVHAAWLAARDPRTAWYAQLFGLVLTAYALSPIDIIPDFIPILGMLDDAILIPVGIWLFVKMLPAGLLPDVISSNKKGVRVIVQVRQ